MSGKRISAIPVLTTRGIEDLHLTSGSDEFEEFICKCILPILLPYDGVNPRSVLLMDIITGCEAQLCFLPPYSPDLMPLEEVFAKVKGVLKANDKLYRITRSPELMIKLAFTHDDCIGYIKHAGYT